MIVRQPNGVRYPLVGGTRQHHFNGTNFKPRKLLKNAPRTHLHDPGVLCWGSTARIVGQFLDLNESWLFRCILLIRPNSLGALHFGQNK